MLKICLVGADKKSVKFYDVDLMDTRFRKFNLNVFYENGFWILNLTQIFGYGFKLDPNIWIWI